MRTLEKIVAVLIVILLVAGIYVALRNIDFFDVEEVDVSVSGPVTKVSPGMQRLINPIKGRNIFEVGVSALEKSLEDFDGVRKVTVRRYYPDKLIITIEYSDIALKAFSVDEHGQPSFYFIHDNMLEYVGRDTWEEFDKLATVQLNPAYAKMIMTYGSDMDSGFASMVALTEHLNSNNLITSIKYDNNSINDFGRLVIGISSLGCTLYVRELVSEQRLQEALAIISSQFSAGGAEVIYDLYANTLVKRT